MSKERANLRDNSPGVSGEGGWRPLWALGEAIWHHLASGAKIAGRRGKIGQLQQGRGQRGTDMAAVRFGQMFGRFCRIVIMNRVILVMMMMAVALLVIDFVRQIKAISFRRPAALQGKCMQRDDQEQKNGQESAHNRAGVESNKRDYNQIKC